MAVIDNVSTLGGGLAQTLLDDIKKGLWEWIKANPDQRVMTVKFWIISKTFYVRDLEPFAELLLGPEPA